MIYQNTVTGDTKELDESLVAAWVAAGNPKANFWVPYTPPPPEPVPTPVYRLSKDTLIQRIKSLGKLTALKTLTDSLPEDLAYEWANSTWFHSNNPLVVSAAENLGLTQEQITALLAFDPDF